MRVTGDSRVETTSKAKVGFWDESELRLARVVEDGAPLSFGLHEVRLGGPYLTELPAGTLLRVTGMRAAITMCAAARPGWLGRQPRRRSAPAGTPLPHLSFTDLSA